MSDPKTQPDSAAPAGPPALAPRLRDVVVGVRPDLDISRHVFRGRPGYVVRDPITFQAHHLSPDDYRILVSISEDQTLGETFNALVEEGALEPEAEEDFYQFLFSLHQLGILNLPVANDKILYQRFERRRRLMRRSQALGVLFLRVPLVNPDDFLNRTMHYARPLFTRTAFVLWLIMIVAAGIIVVTRWSELQAPLLSLLSSGNLVPMWFALIGLKLFHEFGHAYACKHFGGQVPEMGAFFIIFTPCAYVDATASWGFTQRYKRIIVSLAGMYFESIAAAAALFAWAATAPGPLNTFAYQVFLLASVVTVGFNLNPLMRYDGYYVASDLLDVLNLRARAQEQLRFLFDRFALGLPTPKTEFGPGMKLTLVVFGVASVLYKVTLVITMCGVIATKVMIVGLALACGYVAMTLFSAVTKGLKYLWFSPQTAPARTRAIVVSILIITILPSFILFVPVSRPIKAAGQVTHREVEVVRTPVAGFLTDADVQPGQHVDAGRTIAGLSNEDAQVAVRDARAQLNMIDIEIAAGSVADRAAAAAASERRAWRKQALDDALAVAGNLSVVAERPGVVLSRPSRLRPGAYLVPGDELATIGRGPWIVRVMLDSTALVDTAPEVGQLVEARTDAAPDRVITGHIIEIAPAGSRHIEETALTHFGGGEITVDPEQNLAAQPFFRITVLLDDAGDNAVMHGMNAHVRFSAERATIATHAYRQILRFLDHLSANS